MLAQTFQNVKLGKKAIAHTSWLLSVTLHTWYGKTLSTLRRGYTLHLLQLDQETRFLWAVLCHNCDMAPLFAPVHLW